MLGLVSRPLKLSRGRLVSLAALGLVGLVVVGLAAYTVVSLQPRGNPSGQASRNLNERCAPSPCGAPAGFEVDVTAVEMKPGHLALTVLFRNHTQPQLLEAVSYRHTSPADFTLRANGETLRPAFSADCPNWPDVNVQRGATSAPRPLCFPIGSSAGTVLVWNPDLGVVSEPVSIALP